MLLSPAICRLPIRLCRTCRLKSFSVLRCVGDVIMATTQDHRRYAEECVAMARLSDDDNDKVLWLTLAQSWVRLADHVARHRVSYASTADGDEIPDARSPDEECG
jgi:hypothetical protein